MAQIDVYTQPGCGPCVTVKMHLKRAGIAFTEHDITADPDAADTVRELGYQGTPVVVAGDMHTQGYRRDWLDTVVDAVRAEESAPDAHIGCELDAIECCAA